MRSGDDKAELVASGTLLASLTLMLNDVRGTSRGRILGTDAMRIGGLHIGTKSSTLHQTLHSLDHSS